MSFNRSDASYMLLLFVIHTFDLISVITGISINYIPFEIFFVSSFKTLTQITFIGLSVFLLISIFESLFAFDCLLNELLCYRQCQMKNNEQANAALVMQFFLYIQFQMETKIKLRSASINTETEIK